MLLKDLIIGISNAVSPASNALFAETLSDKAGLAVPLVPRYTLGAVSL